jgi:hypothetical protein
MKCNVCMYVSMRVCAVGADDPCCLAWVVCVFRCYAVGLTGRVPICCHMLVSFNVVDFVVWCYILLWCCFQVSVEVLRGCL